MGWAPKEVAEARDARRKAQQDEARRAIVRVLRRVDLEDSLEELAYRLQLGLASEGFEVKKRRA